MTDTGSYVYLAARKVPDEAVEGLTGQAGQPLRLVHKSGLAAVVSTVDLAEFGEKALRRNLEDLGWLERVARAHDAVVQRVGEFTAVAPWRLATIMLDDDRVVDLLNDYKVELKVALDRVEGCSEWSVKLIIESTTPSPGDNPPQSGTAYLEQRRAENSRHTEAELDAAVAADQIHLSLSQATDASTRLPPQDRRLTGYTGEMALNGAYLVPDEQRERFTDLIKELQAGLTDARLEVNGPWPPYTFATLETGRTG